MMQHSSNGIEMHDARDAREKLIKWQTWLHEKLQPDLLQATELRERLQAELREYESLPDNLAAIQQSGTNEMQSMVDIGHDVFVQAHVADTSKVYVKVGLGFAVECDHDDAARIAALQTTHLQHRIDALSNQIADISAHIRIVSQAIADVIGMNDAL